MIALVTGGAGVVGKALCRELLDIGVCVRVLTLPGDTQAGFLPKEVKVFFGDVTDANSLAEAFNNVDVVFHLAAILLSTRGDFDFINAGGTINVLRAAEKANVKRILYVSSISVTYPILTEYGKSKLKGETAVKNSKIPWTIVRPTLVIGNGGGIEFNMFKNYVNKFWLYFLPGGGNCLKRPVKSEDLVKGIALAGTKENALYKTYALGGEKVLTLAQMAKCILKESGKKHFKVNLPWFLAKKLAVLKSFIGGQKVTAEQALSGFLYDAAPSIENAKIDLGYNPGSPF